LPGVLVVSEAYFPGWQATIDGNLTPVFTVHGALLGLELPPGQHDVVLTYRPPVLMAGGLVTALALVLSGFLWLRRWRLPGTISA
jgi:uncharacterized membrane protein YfhO